MKNILVVILGVFLISCADNSSTISDLTGQEVNYTLFSGSDFGFEGTVTIKEKVDGTAQFVIDLDGPTDESAFPAHLHFSSFDTPDAELASVLTPVNATSGISITDLRFLSDDSEVTYEQLLSFDGHIKIHLDDGANQNVILAFGNIGSNKLMLDGEVAQCDGPN